MIVMVSIRQLFSSFVFLGCVSTSALAQPSAPEGGVEYSSLKVTVAPPDAKLQIDGQNVLVVEGIATLDKIESGPHKVAVSHPDYIEKADEITLLPRKLAVLSVQLKGKPSRVEIKSRPRDALVLLDDRLLTYYGATTDYTPVTLTLESGKYVLNLKKDTYITYQQSLVILPNRPQKLTLTLRQHKPISKYLNWIGGAIAVSGAAVGAYGSIVDDKRVRNTGWVVAIGGLGIAASSVGIDSLD